MFVAQVNISLLVSGGDAEVALKALHKEFFEGGPAAAHAREEPIFAASKR